MMKLVLLGLGLTILGCVPFGVWLYPPELLAYMGALAVTLGAPTLLIGASQI